MVDPKNRYRNIAELEPFYMEVGRIASAWGNLEFHMDRLLWDLSDGPQMLAACMTTQLTNAGARLRALIGMVRLREGTPALIKKLNQFEGATTAIIRKRNRAVHDVWHYRPSNATVYQLMVAIEEKTLEFDFKPKALKEMKTLFEEIAAHLYKFLDLEAEIRAELLSVTSPDKWREQLHDMVDAG
jgi:hypothetical protein